MTTEVVVLQPSESTSTLYVPACVIVRVGLVAVVIATLSLYQTNVLGLAVNPVFSMIEFLPQID